MLSLLWNGLIFDPMLNGLVVLYAILGHNFGITIIVFTVLVRLITLPLTLRQIRATKKMTELQPRLKALQTRYAKDKARLSQETMRLYKESGVNPIGCLGPMVIQFPIWIGLYMAIIKVLPTSPENLAGLSAHLYAWLPLVHHVVPLDSHFLWLDLATPDKTYILAVLVGASMWVMQKMTVMPTLDARQQSTNRMMLWMMPFMFAFFTLQLPSGLPVYWFASNLIGIVIQYRVTGWGTLLKSGDKAVPAPADEQAPQEDSNSLPDKEMVNDGSSGDQRQDRRRSPGNRAKGTRRRARGSRSRGR
ncbi:MAG: YidC/Oxa1 family membrane protein insertase [Dehalococcoidia bacterium]